MPAAARIFEPTSHPGIVVGPGVPTVLIGGLPAAVATDIHICLLPPLAGPHPPNAVAKGSVNVLFGGRPAARQGDVTACGATIVSGMPTVQIGG
jgi:uncharacterized Zn-binding protein involved in type VI secretion